jgi:cellulose synthase/poly-beta-1,6-N-acetylglucosamine synthase-like glycosyltransferase
VLAAVGLLACAAVVFIANRGAFDHLGAIHFHIRRLEIAVVFVRPSVTVVLGGILAALAFVLLVVALDAWAARRVSDPARQPQEQAVRPLRREATNARPTSDLRVTVVIPARNEALQLPATIASLRAQSNPPAAIWVVADNCTDDTAGIARANGAIVYETVANQHRKAGGLNQLLAQVLPTMVANDLVMVMDADTSLVPDFIALALAEFAADPALDAVGGLFFGHDAPGLLAQLQRNEYLRYGRDIGRRRGRVSVLTGTATIFRSDALAAVVLARGSVLPGNRGQVYDTYSLTEDNELTIALKTLGASMISPQGCQVSTELMPTWRDLWHQRQRWQRGALENIGMYGFSSATARYWAQQTGLGYGVIALWASFALMALSYVAYGLLVVIGFWFVIGLVFAVERTATVWNAGWRARLIAMPIVIELGYSIFLQAVFLKSMLDIAFGHAKHWNAAVVKPPQS